MRCAQTNRHVPPCAVSEISHMARELFAPVGGRALGLRSEGSWLAAELLRAGLEPGAVDRRAGWTGFCPSNDQPSPRCAPAVPLPARPACAAARTRTSTLPVPPHHRPICPLVSQLTHPCAHIFVQGSTRAFEQCAVRLLGMRFSSKNALYRQKKSGQVQGVQGRASVE